MSNPSDNSRSSSSTTSAQERSIVSRAEGPTDRLIVGNWKLHKTLAESTDFAKKLVAKAREYVGVTLAVAPVFTSLSTVGEALRGSPIGLAAQDAFWEDQGAFTGEVSAALLRDVGCQYVIVGHSERRQYFGDTDEVVRRKTAAVLRHDMDPIVCVGETLEERESGRTEEVVVRQLRAALDGISPTLAKKVVVAYEPVWAIGTGRNALPSDAAAVHRKLRSTLQEIVEEAAGSIRILYGGSVKADNAIALFQKPEIEGALVGGASLSLENFDGIIQGALKTKI